MRVKIRRHAPTAGNLKSNYIGATDEPLSPEGVGLARRVGAEAGVETVFTSALLRTQQTARILYPSARVVVCAGLNEMNFGRFEGRNWQDLDGDADYAAWLESNCEAPCPGGESKAEFTARSRDAFLSLLDGARSDDCIRVVTHGGVIMSVMSELVEPHRPYFSWKTGFCEGYVIESTGKNRFLLVEKLPGINNHEA